MSRFCVLAMIASIVLFGACLRGAAQTPKKPAEDADLKALVEGNNEFAFDLYAQLSKEKGNKFFSPYSISTALGMTYAGARGNTAKEMAKTLHFTLDQERLHSAFGKLIRKVNEPDKKRGYELAVANSLWGDRTNLTLNPKFLKLTQDDYHAGFQLVDFANDAERSRQTINGWVEDKTNKKVVNLLPSRAVTNETRLVLANAIYFKGEWAVPFLKEGTKPSDFTIPGSPPFMVPMMNGFIPAKYMENDDFQLAEFMYKGNEVSMVVILPKKNDGLAEVEKKCSAQMLKQAIARARGADVQVTLPKLKMIAANDLGGDLENLGMKDAFNKNASDLTGVGTMLSRLPIYISGVVHKAYIDVNEQGTEAAAATGVVEKEFIFNPVVAPPHRLLANHPFIFVIRHNSTGAILFMGRLLDPRS